MKIRININITLNRVVKYFILADLLVFGAWGLLQPFFSVYVLDQVEGATLVTVGVSVAIFWILRSLLQPPIANILDKVEGEKDDFYTMIAGLFIVAIAGFVFIFIHRIWELYLVQALQALGFALYVPAWSGIFSRHIDQKRTSFEWALDNSAAGFSVGISGLVGGVVASAFGFSAVFIAISILSLAAAFLLLAVPDLVIPQKSKEESPKTSPVA